MNNEYVKSIAIIGIIISIVTSLTILGITANHEMDIELEKYKIEMQYNQIKNVEE